MFSGRHVPGSDQETKGRFSREVAAEAWRGRMGQSSTESWTTGRRRSHRGRSCCARGTRRDETGRSEKTWIPSGLCCTTPSPQTSTPLSPLSSPAAMSPPGYVLQPLRKMARPRALRTCVPEQRKRRILGERKILPQRYPNLFDSHAAHCTRYISATLCPCQCWHTGTVCWCC